METVRVVGAGEVAAAMETQTAEGAVEGMALERAMVTVVVVGTGAVPTPAMFSPSAREALLRGFARARHRKRAKGSAAPARLRLFPEEVQTGPPKVWVVLVALPRHRTAAH